MSFRPRIQRHTEGEAVRCTGHRVSRNVVCGASLGLVPKASACISRPIRNLEEAAPGTLSVECDSCGSLTEIRTVGAAESLLYMSRAS